MTFYKQFPAEIFDRRLFNHLVSRNTINAVYVCEFIYVKINTPDISVNTMQRECTRELTLADI